MAATCCRRGEATGGEEGGECRLGCVSDEAKGGGVREQVRMSAPRGAVVAGVGSARLSALTRRAAEEAGCRWERVERSQLPPRQDHVQLVLLDCFGNSSASLNWVRRLRDVFPRAALVLLLTRADPAVRDLSRLARAGLDECVFLDTPNALKELTTLMRLRVGRELPDELQLPVGQIGDALVRACVQWIWRSAVGKISVSRVGDWFGVTSQQLNRRLRRTGFPATHIIVRHARLSHVACELERMTGRASVVARRLAFETEKDLGMFVRRSMGISVRALYEAGPLELVQHLNRKLCERHEARPKR